MKRTMQNRLLAIMIAIVLITGVAGAAEGSAVWLGSIAVESPTKVATDSIGRVFVVEAKVKRLSMYDRNGMRVGELYELQSPRGIAVDSAGKIYIGNDRYKDRYGKTYRGNVQVYEVSYNSGTQSYGFNLVKTIEGIAPLPEIIQPDAIGVLGNGDIYIVDSYQHKVLISKADSTWGTFGGYDAGTRDANGIPVAGSAEGKFNVPLDIVLDETAGELYIIDLGVFISLDNSGNQQLQRGARVQVFDLSGNVLSGRTFGKWGQDSGEITNPAGIAMDKMGILNITDTLMQTVHRFHKDNEGNPDGRFIEDIKDPDHPLTTPTGIAVGQDERMYIVSAGSIPPGLEIYALEGYTSLAVTPKEMTLSGYAGGTAAGQDITISNSGPGAMQWTIQRAAGCEWITLSKESGQTGGSTSEAVTVGADLSSISAGTYTGKFKVITGGAEEEVTVNLQVTAGARLEVTPVELTYTGQAEGGAPAGQTLNITLTGGTAGWTAKSNAGWLKIYPETGSAAGVPVQALVTIDSTGLAAGQNQSSITITADGATGSPVEVNVKLTLISAGQIEVTANIEEARWNITGEAAYQGGTKQWSQQDAPSGQYQISFEAVSGYMKPQDQAFTVQSGKTTAIEVNYKDLRALKKIVAGLGSGNRNPAEIKILNTDGTLAGADFIAFSYKYGVNVAAGDIDGDGLDEIIAGAGVNKVNPARVKIFKADGSEIPGADFMAFKSRYGANVAAGDLDGDGTDEIIVGSGIGSGNSANIRVFKSINAVITDTGINSIVDTTRYGVYVAAGDIDGDGTDEIITGSGPDPRAMAVVRIFKADASAGVGSWSATQIKEITVNEAGKGAVVAAGDLNADGKAEILAGSSNTLNIKTYNAEGSAYGVEITQANTDTGASIAAGDTDADGTAEIVLGAGASKGNPSEVRIYSAEGTFKNSFTGFSQPGGVNVCVGKVQ